VAFSSVQQNPFPARGRKLSVMVLALTLGHTARVQQNPFPARGRKLKGRRATEAQLTLGSTEPFPRKGTETIQNATFVSMYCNESSTEPFPRKGTETQRIGLQY